MDESKTKKTVCVHWLNGQCKKGESCEYLHVYQEDKIPACKYFTQEGLCQKGDKCIYRHVANSSNQGGFSGVLGILAPGLVLAGGGVDKRLEECPYYERGFCKHKFLQCSFGHLHRKICANYMIGFCPKGPNCELEHVKSVIAESEWTLKDLANFSDEENHSDRCAVAATNGLNLTPFQKPMNNVRCH